MGGLDPTQLDRYSRHVIMDAIGPDGQAQLGAATVLVVGAGGLGSPVIQYLAAAGVGELVVIDDDVVERSNLQRQVIHRDTDVGVSKVESAARYVQALNPDVDVSTYATRFHQSNAESLVDAADLVVDCSDNFPTRFLLNDAAVLTDTPFVHGAVYRFEGQATTVTPGAGPCYRCIFPEAPPPGTVPDCAEAGVIGSMPGLIGSMQATEAIKLIVGAGEVLAGRLVVINSMGFQFDTVPIAVDPACPVCGDDAGVGSVKDLSYEGACAIE